MTRATVVPQTGHFPTMARRPFFQVTSFPSLMSRLARHLTQYPCINFHPLLAETIFSTHTIAQPEHKLQAPSESQSGEDRLERMNSLLSVHGRLSSPLKRPLFVQEVCIVSSAVFADTPPKLFLSLFFLPSVTF